MFEAMREAERDPALRERMGAMLAQYRELMVQAVRADQERGAVFAGAPADAIATLLGAVGDGLLLHALLDPGLDVAGAIAAPRAARRARGQLTAESRETVDDTQDEEPRGDWLVKGTPGRSGRRRGVWAMSLG